MKHLIVTADDLGLAKSINEGIAKAYSEGIITSISVISAGEAFEDAVRVIKELGLKEIGAHLSLTETRPLLSTSKFYKNHNEFFYNFFLKKISTDEIHKELKVQLELLKKAGVRITHINSHEHIHIIPQVLDVFIRLAREYNIPAIRYPRGDRPARPLSLREVYKSFILKYFTAKTDRILHNSNMVYTDFFIGLLDAGRLNIAIIKEMIKTLKDGVTEIVTHPGFLSPEILEHYAWHTGGEAELFALTDNRVKNAIKNNSIKLITYGELVSIRQSP